MCLAMNREKTLVATGQVGAQPLIFVWDSVDATKLGFFMLPKGSRSVTAIAFNRTSNLIAFSDFSNDNNIYVIEWQKSQ